MSKKRDEKNRLRREKAIKKILSQPSPSEFPTPRDYLVSVIDDTMDTIKKGVYQTPTMEKPVDFRPQLKRCKKWTAKFDRIPELHPHLSPMLPSPKVYVENIDVLEKAAEFGEDGVCLNMANAYHPGGGVLRGSMAQEEEICRRSTLTWGIFRFSPDLKDLVGFKWDVYGSYPISTFGAIWSPSVAIIKSKNYEYIPELLETNVITAAAINRPEIGKDGKMNEKCTDITLKKIRSVLRLAAAKGKRKLILGAWGCGAFHNPPKQVAELFKQVIYEPEFEGWFEEICFAVLDNPHRTENNYPIFLSVFGDKNQYELCEK